MSRARRPRSSSTERGEERPDLTPMVDIVFNLIVFFMVVSELADATVSDLRLAPADQARELKVDGERLLAVNVLAGGELEVRGRRVAKTALPKLVALEALGCPREPADAGVVLAPSSLRLSVRADRDAAFGGVHGVLDAAQRSGVYRTSFAAASDPPDRRAPAASGP